ncbi:MAG: insulinase family protein, partial [Rhodospirillales bacterium]|nr:insulinase family protein [Rhodospirillales bacterium]
HPYHRPVIGWEAEVAKLSLQDATDFYRKYYAPNNAILVISGDVTAEQVKPLAEKYYGGLTPHDTPPRLRAPEPPPVAARRVELRDAKVKQPAWNRTYLAPSYNRGATQYAYPLQVLAEVIGGGTTSQLFQNLVVKQQLATGAGAWYEPVAVDLSTFGIHASPRPGVPMEKIEAAILAEVYKIVTEGVPADEVERAKQRLKANVTYARDSYHTGANVLGQALTTGQTVADVEAWPQRIMTVTPQQVVDAARELFKDAQSVTGVLLPADETHTAAGKAG